MREEGAADKILDTILRTFVSLKTEIFELLGIDKIEKLARIFL